MLSRPSYRQPIGGRSVLTCPSILTARRCPRSAGRGTLAQGVCSFGTLMTSTTPLSGIHFSVSLSSTTRCIDPPLLTGLGCQVSVAPIQAVLCRIVQTNFGEDPFFQALG